MKRMLTIFVEADWEGAKVSVLHGSTGDVTNEFYGTDIEACMSRIGTVLDSERRAEDAS